MALAALPFAANNYVIRLTTIAFMYVDAGVIVELVGGFTGYPSFATAAFFGLGAYSASVFAPALRCRCRRVAAGGERSCFSR